MRQLASSLTRREFIERHPYGFLVLHAQFETEQSIRVFATQALPVPKAELDSREITALPIRKNAENPFQAHISVGRARNCDLVIRHPSVSKLHARLRAEPGQLTLIDAGSQNGTFINGTRLLPQESMPIGTNDQLLFGSVPARTARSEEIYSLLSRPL